VHADAFDTFLLKSGINLKLTQGTVSRYVTKPSRWQMWLAKCNARCTQTLMLGVNASTMQHAKTYAAMLLGNKGLLTDGQKQNFNITGTMHLFAVSGIHVGVVALTLNLVLGILRLPTGLTRVISLAGAYAYVHITGYAPSAERAFLMVAFLYLGQSLRRQTSVWRAWVACALFVLIMRPAALFAPGFVLSYSAVAGLILYGGPLSHRILTHYGLYTQPFEPYFTWNQKLKVRSSRFVIKGLCACLGASVLCIPLSAYYFSTFSLMGLFFNLIIMSWISLVIVQGTLSLCLSWLPGVSSFINKGAFLILMLTEKCLIKNIPSTGLTWWKVGPNFENWVTIYSCINLVLMIGLHLKGPAPAWLYWLITGNFVLCCLLSLY
jgi:competence protein ComEC